MAVQEPTRADAIQIENSDSPVGPRLIESRLSDGSLFFTDPKVPSGVALFELAGLQRAHNTIVVSQTGEAASKDQNNNPVTSLQKALDLIPDSSDVNSPWLILMMPGVYDENILWVKDFVFVEGLGSVTLRSPTDQDTIRILQGISTVPRRGSLSGVRVENSFSGRSCVRVLSSKFASATLTFSINPNIGDFVTIQGVQFQAVPNGSVVGANQFEIGLTVEETVLNLVSSIQDPVNGLTSVIFPSGALNVVTLRSFEPGVIGNTFTLTSSVPLIMTPSSPTFTGGEEVTNGSTVAFYGVSLKNCDLVATGLNGYQIRAQAVNNILVSGGDWTDSASGVTFVEMREVSSFSLSTVIAQRIELHYDSGSTSRPFLTTSSYKLNNVEILGQMYSELIGEGSLSARFSEFENVSISGNRPFLFKYCQMIDVLVGMTSSLTLSNCKRNTLGGTGTVRESEVFGSLTFANSVSETFTFDVPGPDNLYTVLVESSSGDLPFIPFGNKTSSDFTIDFAAPFTGTVHFIVKRNT